MHIPDLLLSPPVAAATAVLGCGVFGYSLRRVERGSGERTTVLLGIMAAFVFAAQTVNFPVGPGVTGHLLGGVLAAVMLGPWGGSAVIGTVLIAQCFLFGDGGVTALGANYLNMGFFGAICGYAIYAPLRRAIGGPRGVLIAAMVAAWFAVILAAGAFSVELAASGRISDLPRVLGWMVLVHAAIGLGEALVTGLAIRFVLLIRPDLIHEPDTPSGPVRAVQLILAGLGIAAAVAVFLGPLAWDAPDGLEFVGAKLGFIKGEAPAVLPAPIPDYEMPGLERRIGLATALAGLVGTIAVFALGMLLARAFGQKQTPTLLGVEPAHAA